MTTRTLTWLTVCSAGALLLALTAARPAAPATGAAAAAPQCATLPRASVPLSATAAQQFWRRYNCASLWQLQPQQGEQAQAGFFGKEGCRIEFVLLQVRRDAQQPQLYHVQGKSRCLRNIAVPFHGTIVLRQVARATADASQYTITGSFSFEEDKIARNTGTYRGTLLIDVAIDGDGRLGLGSVPGSEVNGCGYKFDGRWTSTEGRVESVAWARDWRALGNELFSDFDIGDRSMSISPKYTKVGWNRLWEHEEWWTDAPSRATLLNL